MKKLLFILAASLFFLASCKNKDDKSIVGKWKPVEMNMKNMNENEKKEFLEHAVIEFTSDNKFIATRSDIKSNGTFILNEKTSQLTTRNPEGDTQTYTLGWEDDKMLLANEDGTVKLKRQ